MWKIEFGVHSFYLICDHNSFFNVLIRNEMEIIYLVLLLVLGRSSI